MAKRVSFYFSLNVIVRAKHKKLIEAHNLLSFDQVMIGTFLVWSLLGATMG